MQREKHFADRRPSSVSPLYAVDRGASLLTVALSWTGGCNAAERLTSWNTEQRHFIGFGFQISWQKLFSECFAAFSLRLSLLLSHLTQNKTCTKVTHTSAFRSFLLMLRNRSKHPRLISPSTSTCEALKAFETCVNMWNNRHLKRII